MIFFLNVLCECLVVVFFTIRFFLFFVFLIILLKVLATPKAVRSIGYVCTIFIRCTQATCTFSCYYLAAFYDYRSY